MRVTGDRLPFTVESSGGVPGGTVEIDASASSQFVSGLLLSAPSFAGGVEVRHTGAPVPSMQYFGSLNGWTELGDSALAVWTSPTRPGC